MSLGGKLPPPSDETLNPELLALCTPIVGKVQNQGYQDTIPSCWVTRHHHTIMQHMLCTTLTLHTCLSPCFLEYLYNYSGIPLAPHKLHLEWTGALQWNPLSVENLVWKQCVELHTDSTSIFYVHGQGFIKSCWIRTHADTVVQVIPTVCRTCKPILVYISISCLTG